MTVTLEDALIAAAAAMKGKKPEIVAMVLTKPVEFVKYHGEGEMTEDQLRKIVAEWSSSHFVPFVHLYMASAGAALYSVEQDAELPGEILGRIRMMQESSAELSLVDLAEADVLKALEELKSELFLPSLAGAIAFREIEPPCAFAQANPIGSDFRLLVRVFYWHVADANAGALVGAAGFTPISGGVEVGGGDVSA